MGAWQIDEVKERESSLPKAAIRWDRKHGFEHNYPEHLSP